MQLSDIKTELFQKVTFTDYGIRLETFDLINYEKNKHHHQRGFYFLYVHVLKSGGVNINTTYNIHLTIEQLEEIIRVSKIITEENKGAAID